MSLRSGSRRGGRHRRPSLSRRGAGEGAFRAGHFRRARHRPARQTIWRRLFRRALCIVIASATPSGGSLLARAKAVLTLLAGSCRALWLIGAHAAGRRRRLRRLSDRAAGASPRRCCGMPTILHEQNAVMGRANRFLAARVDAVAHGFPTLKGLGGGIKAQDLSHRQSGSAQRARRGGSALSRAG